MTTEQNKAIARRFYEAFEANDQAAFNDLLHLTSWLICPAHPARRTAKRCCTELAVSTQLSVNSISP